MVLQQSSTIIPSQGTQKKSSHLVSELKAMNLTYFHFLSYFHFILFPFSTIFYFGT